MDDIKIVNVDLNNVSEYGFYCSKNLKYEGYQLKLDWLRQRFSQGLKIKLLHSNTEGAIGFIEYIPGEYTWRAVNASGYLVIHCIYIEKRKHRGKGYASTLLKECIEDAQKEERNGVAMVTSKGPWLAKSDILLKNGFEVIDKAPPYYELLAKQIRKGVLPKFTGDWEKRLEKYSGLNIIYANQCPYNIKSVTEICNTAKEKGLEIRVFELNNPVDAQNAPSPYGVFSLVYNGELLADHYTSKSRFLNILKKELP